MGGVVGAENAGVVEGYVYCAGEEEGEEPETDDGGEDQGYVFCAELLDDELYVNNGMIKGKSTRTTRMPIDIGTMEPLRLGAGTAIPMVRVLYIKGSTRNSTDDRNCRSQ